MVLRNSSSLNRLEKRLDNSPAGLLTMATIDCALGAYPVVASVTIPKPFNTARTGTGKPGMSMPVSCFRMS